MVACRLSALEVSGITTSDVGEKGTKWQTVKNVDLSLSTKSYLWWSLSTIHFDKSVVNIILRCKVCLNEESFMEIYGF